MSIRPPRRELGPAFNLVRQILSQGPRSFQAIVAEGLKLHPVPSSSSSTTPAPRYIEHPELPTSLRKARKPLNTIRIPPGHPFYSCHFLKKTILTQLQSQHLIHSEPIRRTGSERQSTAQLIRDNSGSTFQFLLSSPPAASKNDPLSKWSFPEHWNRLISGENPARPAIELQNLIEGQKKSQIEKRKEKGTLARTEREIWAWEDRTPELTTRLQRLHLNTRNQKGRSLKEAKNLKLRKEFDAAREEAKKLVEAL